MKIEIWFGRDWIFKKQNYTIEHFRLNYQCGMKSRTHILDGGLDFREQIDELHEGRKQQTPRGHTAERILGVKQFKLHLRTGKENNFNLWKIKKKRINRWRIQSPVWMLKKYLERWSPAIKLPNSPRMYPPTFTIFSWHAGAWRACDWKKKMKKSKNQIFWIHEKKGKNMAWYWNGRNLRTSKTVLAAYPCTSSRLMTIWMTRYQTFNEKSIEFSNKKEEMELFFNRKQRREKTTYLFANVIAGNANQVEDDVHVPRIIAGILLRQNGDLQDHLLADRVVRGLEVRQHFLDNFLRVRLVTHCVQQIDRTLPDTHITLGLNLSQKKNTLKSNSKSNSKSNPTQIQYSTIQYVKSISNPIQIQYSTIGQIQFQTFRSIWRNTFNALITVSWCFFTASCEISLVAKRHILSRARYLKTTPKINSSQIENLLNLTYWNLNEISSF